MPEITVTPSEKPDRDERGLTTQEAKAQLAKNKRRLNAQPG